MAHAQVHGDPALAGPVHIPQVQQQRELVHDQGQRRAVADRHGRMPPVPVLAADGDRADPGQQADAPQVMVQVRPARAEVAERPPARPGTPGATPRVSANVPVNDSQLSRALRCPSFSSSWYAVRTAAGGGTGRALLIRLSLPSVSASRPSQGAGFFSALK